MRVLLLQPNYDSHILHPPLSLGYLAGTLLQSGHEVNIFDGTLKAASEQDYLDEIATYKPDLVGISVMTRAHQKVMRLTKAIKGRFDTPVVVGGPQVSSYPAEILSSYAANYAVFGEGELTLLELVSALEHGSGVDSIEGMAFRQEGHIVVNPRRPLIRDINSLPMAAWHLMPPTSYRIVPILAPPKAQPLAPIFTTRGCPYSCTFCATNVTWSGRLRRRNPVLVVDEIEMLVREFGVKEIHISDDNFTVNRRHAETVCDEILRRNIHISWQCPNGVRIDTLDLPLLRKMKEAGCYSLGLGIETGSKIIQGNIKKKLDLDVVARALHDMKKVGMRAYGFFIVGLPGDTHETIRETIDFAKKMPFDRAWFNVLTPYPGSEIFNDYMQRNNLTLDTIDWDALDGNACLLPTEELTAAEIEHYQTQALREFYLRPRVLLSVAREMGPGQIRTFLMSRFARRKAGVLPKAGRFPDTTPGRTESR